MVAPAAAVAVCQVVPPSSDTFTTSPAKSAALSVPEMVCVAVLVMKSVALDPVSAEKATVLTNSVGAPISVATTVVALSVAAAPAVSVSVMVKSVVTVLPGAT